MVALREILAHFGIEVDDKKLKQADAEIGDFIGKLQKMGRVAAEAFAVYEIVDFAKGVADAGQKIANQAVQLGVSAGYIQQLGFASQAAGQDADFLVTSMGRLQYAAVEAGRSAGGPGAQAFQKLGIHVKDAAGQMKGADVLFAEVSDGLAKMKNPTERAAAATELFGRSGRQLLPFLTRGSAGIKELQADFERLGGGLSPDAIKKASAFEKAWARASLAITSLKGRIFEVIGPPLTWIIDHLATAAGWFARMLAGTNAVRDAFIALGVVLAPLALELAVAFAPLLLAAAAVAALYLLFDDLIGLFEGKDSEIGAVMDLLGGKGTSTEFVKEMKDGWESVKNVFVEMKPVAEALWEIIKAMAHGTAELVKDLWQLGGGVGEAAFKVGQVISGKAGTTLTTGEVGNLFGTGSPGAQPQTATLPGPQGFTRSGGDAQVLQTNNTTFHIVGLDPEATANAVAQKLDDHHKARNAEAHKVLVKQVAQR